MQMSIDGKMNHEDVVHIYNGILLSLKKNDIVPFAVTWMGLEIFIMSEASQTKTNMISLICGI